MIDFFTARRKFLSHLRSRSELTKGYASPDTQRTYDQGLARFQNHLVHLGIEGLERVTAEHIREHLSTLRQKGLAAATVALQRTILGSFFGWASKNYKHIADIAADVEAIRPDASESPHMTWQQVSNLLNYLWKDRKARKRDALLFELAAHTGARVSEISRLDLTSVMLTDTEVIFKLLGKGNKPRAITIPLAPESSAAQRFKKHIEEYLRRRARWRCSERDRTALFLTNAGNRIRPRNIQAAFDYYRKRLHLEAFTPHSLRHAYVTRLLQQGADAATVAKLAGHASPQITLTVYAHTDERRMKEASASAFD